MSFNEGILWLAYGVATLRASVSFIRLNQLSTSCCASAALAPSITRYRPSLSTPPRVTKPSRTVLCGQSSLTVWKLLPSPYPAFVLNGITVFPFRLYWRRKLLTGGGNCIPQVGKPRKTNRIVRFGRSWSSKAANNRSHSPGPPAAPLRYSRQDKVFPIRVRPLYRRPFAG